MTPEHFARTRQQLDLRTGYLSRLLRIDRRTVQRWTDGTLPIPRAHELVLRLLEDPDVRATIEEMAHDLEEAG